MILNIIFKNVLRYQINSFRGYRTGIFLRKVYYIILFNILLCIFQRLTYPKINILQKKIVFFLALLYKTNNL